MLLILISFEGMSLTFSHCLFFNIIFVLLVQNVVPAKGLTLALN